VTLTKHLKIGQKINRGTYFKFTKTQTVKIKNKKNE
jgi:hypothetical protein